MGSLGLPGLLGPPVIAKVTGALGARGGSGGRALRACTLGGVWAPRGSKNGPSNSSINLSGLGSFSKSNIEDFLKAFLILLLIKSSTNGGL